MTTTYNQPVQLTHAEWENLKTRLVEEHGPKILISWVCRRELGFTVREHHDYKVNEHNADWRDRFSVIMLDFYDDAQRSYFMLRYR